MKNSILAFIIIVLTVAPSLVGEQDDIALAGSMINKIKM